MADISPDTRLNQVLDAVPGALDYIVSLNPHDFERLRNPVLRRYMSSRITLSRVAAMAGISAERLLHNLTRLSAGLPVDDHKPEAPDSREVEEARTTVPPDWFRAIDPATIPWVDVVPIDEVSGDPFPPISLAVKQLAPGGVLGIRHRWEPQPLYDIWAKMALEWFAQRIDDHEWYVFVHRPASVAAYPIKPVIGAAVGEMPQAEVLPRLQVPAERLEPGQSLEATGLSVDQVAVVREALRQRLGPLFQVEDDAQALPKRVLRVTHLAT